MCLYPKLIRNRKFTATKKNGGYIPPLPLAVTPDGEVIRDRRVEWVSVGCGKCIECRKKKSREWQVRLLEEVRENKKAVFVTMTFSNESIKELSIGMRSKGYERDNEIATKAMRRFLERWRKRTKKSVRHWMVTELGHEGTENIHMHGIIWTEEIEEIKKTWKYGYVTIGDGINESYVNGRTVNYITKYITKTDDLHKYYIPKVLTSAGIGKGYIKRKDKDRNKYNGKETKETYKNEQGHEMGIPIYWRNHLYTEEERQELWLNKLDEEVRYVMGQKIDISKGEEEYYKALEYYRRKNKQLGYGDDEIDWDRKKYEEERREMQYEKRTGFKTEKEQNIWQAWLNKKF